MLLQEAVDFSPRGHGGLRATSGHGDGRGRGSKAGCRPGVEPFHQGYGERAVEAVAGADRVDDFNRECTDPFGSVFSGDVRRLPILA